MNLLSFDSKAGKYAQPLGDPFDATYDFSTPLRNIKRIYLKSIELPVAFSNIRASGTYNTFSIIISGTTYSATIPDTVYTSLSTVLTAITSAFASLSLPNSAVLTLTATSSGTNVICTLSGTAPTTFSIANTVLGYYILGFKKSSTMSTSGNNTTITALGYYQLNVDNYITMYLYNIPSINNTNFEALPSSFKIPMNTVNNVVYFNEENTSFAQYITVSDPHYVISQIRVKLLDRFNNQLSNHYVDYSFTLGFEEDIRVSSEDLLNGKY